MSDAAAMRPKTGMEARMSGVSAGTVVQSPAGESIGTVKDIVPNTNTGQPDYVVIAMRSGTTAVPYAAVVPLFHDGHVVLDRARLESAPRVSESQLQDTGSAEWKKKADRYWQAL
jgi:sporulation protein YlmC with PRC-barrel domain